MNTNTTSFAFNLLADKAIRLKYLCAFSVKAHNKTLTSRDIFIRCILTGKPLTKCFSPITNPVKLANGKTPYACLLSHARLFANTRFFREDLAKDLFGATETDEAKLFQTSLKEAASTLVKELS